MKTPDLVRLVCTLVPRSVSVALYERTVPEPALLRDSEPSLAPVLALFRVVPAPLSSVGVLGGHIPALLGAPHCTWYVQLRLRRCVDQVYQVLGNTYCILAQEIRRIHIGLYPGPFHRTVTLTPTVPLDTSIPYVSRGQRVTKRCQQLKRSLFP